MRQYLLAGLILTLATQAHADFTKVIGGGRGNGAVGTEAVIEPLHLDCSSGTLVMADNGGFQVRALVGNTMVKLAQPLGRPIGLARKADGSVYFTTQDKFLFHLAPNGSITPLSVGGMVVPYGVAVGSDALYVSDQALTSPANSAVYKYPLFVGQPQLCVPKGVLRNPTGLAVKTIGGVEWLFISDTTNARIVRTRADCTGTILPVAGTGDRGFAGDGGPATAAWLNFPNGIAVGPDNSLVIADSSNHRVRLVSPQGIISTIAGAPTPWTINQPSGVAICSDGTIYAGSAFDKAVYSIDVDGIPTPIATSTSTRTRTPTQVATATATATSIPTCQPGQVPECVQ